MLPAGHIGGQDRWVRAEVAADHPGRRYQWSDLHFLHDATELERAGWILACLLTRPHINPALTARVRALLDAAPEPEPEETPWPPA